MYVPLVTYSVHIPPLGNLCCTYGSFWRLFCTYTFPFLTFSLQVPRLHSYSYTSDFCGLFFFLSPRDVSYHDRARTSGDLFCTHTSTRWLILYIWNFLMAFCINTFPHVEVPPLHGFVYILLPFIACFVYLLLLNELFIWVIFKFGHSSGDLFCTRAFSWWPILYIGKIFVHYLF